ncbi:MAG: hypothetical protein J6L83_06920 [Clostridia bacterium]|nr:hypothetical protein [Clostridia bacterium]
MKIKKKPMIIELLLTVAVVIAMIGVLSIVVFAEEGEEREIIPVPDIPAIDRPYKTIEELGIDFESIDAYFPRQIEVKHENGKVYVEDFGARSVEINDSNGYAYLELIDGYWTADIEGELQVIFVNSFEEYSEDRYWSVTYDGDGTRDPYVVVNDSTKGVYISFTSEYKNVTVQYSFGDYNYEDIYSSGVLYTHGVSNRNDTDRVEAIYEVNGSLSYGKLYTDTHYYYFPDQGWSSSWVEFVACDTPEGYENIDETYFTANKPSLICAEAKGDDMVHDMSAAFCTAPSTCKNGCGYTIGTIEHHDWQIVDGKKECSLCDAVFFPDFEFIDRTYNNFEESDFPYDEIKAVFPEVLTVKFEDGKYMVKDVGADKAKVYNDVDYIDIELSLVDGWWICELDEEIYNDESIKLFCYFEGKIDGIYWNITYTNGKVRNDLYLMSMSEDLGVWVYYDDYDRVCSMYCVGDRQYNDEYKNGALDSQEGSIYVGEDHVYIEYLADGSLERVRIYIGEDWYYYYPDGVWEKGVEVLLTPPAGYENYDVAYFESILPTTINCTHENYSEADCETPERCVICGIAKDGSAALGHDMADATCTSPAICKNGCGYTEGDALGHDMADADCTEPMTCRVCGHTEGEALGHFMADANCTSPKTCTVCGHTEGEALGHDWIDATCTSRKTCAVCGRTEGKALGHDWIDATYDAPKFCSICGKKVGLPLQRPEIPSESNSESESETESESGSEVESKTESGSEIESETEKETETKTEKPDETEGKTSAPESETDEAPEKSGCGSSIAMGAIALITVFGAALVFKRKENS